ncbi:MAG: archaellin/type IV pilin N-terminal domain-containing protein [Thermoplasmatota archaeon]
MEKKHLDKLVGQPSKIVTREPGEQNVKVINGILEGVDYNAGFVIIDSNQGFGALRIENIIAIKPSQKHKKSIEKNDHAMVGIGTLIVFIAMILVAAVAASVIIQASESLQQKAQNVATQTTREVSAGLVITDITGFTNTNKTEITHLALTVRPRAGSKDIDLSLCTLTTLCNNLSLLTIDENLVAAVNTDNKSVFKTPVSPGSDETIIGGSSKTKFGVISIHDPDNSITSTHGMNSGDRIFVIVNLSAIITDEGGLSPRESISGEIQPETGAPGVYDITAPAVFAHRIIPLL